MEAWRRAMQLSYTNIRSEKAKISQERNSDKDSLEAVDILKQAMDKEDKYLIYKINNLQFNQQPDYMYLKAVHLWLSWHLIWTGMGWSIPYKVRKPIFMAVIPDELDIKLLHYLSTI